MAISRSWSCVFAFMLAVCSAGSIAQETEGGNPSDNVLEAFGSPERAQALLDRERRAVATATRPTRPGKDGALEKEDALVRLGQLARDYAATDFLSSEQRNLVRREGASAYIEAAEMAMSDGRIRYTDRVAELAHDLGDRTMLDSVFRQFLAVRSDERNRYLALFDYGRALAKFGDQAAADRQFIEAITLRPDREDGFGARMAFAFHLRDTGRPQQALDVLREFDEEDRKHHLSLALLRQELMHAVGVDTAAVDNEMDEMRERLSSATGLGPIAKLSASSPGIARNTLGLAEAGAFAHTNPLDDSRIMSGWLTPNFGLSYYSAMVVNAAEVIYNEARGEPPLARRTVAWSIRNRANQAMSPCDAYYGAQGGPWTSTCRTYTPNGPQAEPWRVAANKAFSCVVHGGTYIPGQSTQQMNAAHEDIFTLYVDGHLDLIIDVLNGFVPDPVGGYWAWPEQEVILIQDPWDPSIIYPQWITIYNTWSGNPEGAQEWRNFNYCAQQLPAMCKVAVGNVHGDQPHTLPTCPGSNPPMTGDNFFWRRDQ